MSAAACGVTCVFASVVRASLCRFVCLARVPAVLSDCVLVFPPSRPVSAGGSGFQQQLKRFVSKRS